MTSRLDQALEMESEEGKRGQRKHMAQMSGSPRNEKQGEKPVS